MRTDNFSPSCKSPFFSPPREVTVDGRSIPIRWDFKTAFRFMEYVDSSQDDDEVFLKTILDIWYPLVPENTDAALNEAIRFYCGGSSPKEGYYQPVCTPNIPREEIYLEFLETYGIDLNKENIHWWVFRKLLKNKNERRTRTWTKSKFPPSPPPTHQT